MIWLKTAVAGFEDVDDELIRDVPDLAADIEDLDLDVNVDGLLEGVEEDDSWSDDPVRMYLTQMGEIPLLTRREEVTLGPPDRDHPSQVCRRVLSCDYVMQTAVQGSCVGSTRASCRSTARCKFP